MTGKEPLAEQVISRKRVADHGEVLTGKREVNAMLDLVKQETERIESRFLEPACGTGNFLTAILERKLDVVEKRYGKSQLDFERYAVFAVSSIYGIDILEDNVRQCRHRLYGVFDCGYYSRLFKNRDHDGPCSVQTMWDGEPFGPPMRRRLDDFDVLVRRNEAVSILDKVRAFRVNGKPEPTLEKLVSSRKPFGFPTNFHGSESPKSLRQPIKLYGSQRISWIKRTDIQLNPEWIDQREVLMTCIQGTSAAVETMFLSRPIIAGPGEACSETYPVAGRFDSKLQAGRHAAYLRTRFVRFLVSLRKSTQHANRSVYAFVPDISLNREWTDEKLYERYGLAKEEIAFIESVVRPMPADNYKAGGEASDE